MQYLEIGVDAGQCVLEEPVHEKPIFWHSLHKRMWSIIAELNCSKRTALGVLAEAGVADVYLKAGYHRCFACAVGNASDGMIPCRCPLEWPTSKFTHPCISKDSFGTEDGLYMRCDNLLGVDGAEEERKALAAQIRDLPLSKHATLYNIR